MRNWLKTQMKNRWIAFAAVGLFLLVVPTAGNAQNCGALRWACAHKGQLELQGAGTCERYRTLCTRHNQCGDLRWACEHKDELGLQGAGTCERYRQQCGG
jgi:hypothetical protein